MLLRRSCGVQQQATVLGQDAAAGLRGLRKRGQAAARPGQGLAHSPHATSAGGGAVPWRGGCTAQRRLCGPQCSSPGPSAASGSRGPLTARDRGRQSSTEHSSHMAPPGARWQEPFPSSDRPGWPRAPYMQKQSCSRCTAASAGGPRGRPVPPAAVTSGPACSWLTVSRIMQAACRAQGHVVPLSSLAGAPCSLHSFRPQQTFLWNFPCLRDSQLCGSGEVTASQHPFSPR